MDKIIKRLEDNLIEKAKIAKRINEILAMADDPIGVLSWWFSPNARLECSHIPWEHLLWYEATEVLMAAEALLEDSG